MKQTFLLLLLFTFCGNINAQKNKVENPIQNFEKLWTEFDLRYVNFDLKKVDWKEIYNKYRPLVNENTTNEQLFDICCSMLQELNDGHVTIKSKSEKMECGPPYEFLLDTEFKTDEESKQFAAVINTTLTKNRFSKPIRCTLTKDTNFQYRTADDFGYLRLDEMTEKITFGKVKKAIDEAVKAFHNKEGLIIDLRFNGGGWDYISFQLASRFIEKGKAVGHYKRTKIKGKNTYTKMKYKSVNSGGKYQFTKPIVVLTSDYSASATEVFLLLMKDLPYVTIIGDTTEGIFSDMYEFRLPNKWIVTLSHQHFFCMNKRNYEGIGIEPDIRVLNSKADIETQSDPVIEMAIQHLRKENNSN